MWLLYVQLLKGKNRCGQGCSAKRCLQRRSLTRKKLV